MVKHKNFSLHKKFKTLSSENWREKNYFNGKFRKQKKVETFT